MLHLRKNADDFTSDFRCDFTILLAHIFAERGFHGSCVNQLNFPFAAFLLPVGQNPNECPNSCVVEHILRQCDDSLNQVVFNQIAAGVAFPTAGVPRENGRAVMYLGNAAAQRSILFHFCHIVQKEQQLTIACPRDHGHLFSTFKIGIKPGIQNFLFAAHLFCVNLPAFPVRRIGQHEIKLPCGVSVQGKRRAITDMFRLFPITFEQHIRLADCICFGVHFLSEQMNRYILSILPGNRQKPVLRDSKHTACPAGAIITGIGGVLDLIRNRHKDKICHQFNDIAGRPVFACLLVVFLVEFANQLLKDCPHAVVVKSGMLHYSLCIVFIDWLRREVDIWRNKFLNNCPQNISLNHRINLIAELELLQNLLHIRGETVQVSLKVGL